MKFRWTISAPQLDACSRLAAEGKISPLLAQCLINRGISDSIEASRFLRPRLKDLADPFSLPNMAAAVDRLLAARQRGELLVIFGDYDVDGVSSTAMLLEALRALGWKAAHYLPHRFEEGYGFSPEAVKKCLDQFPAQMLLAVDCGSTACEAIANLAARGIDVVVLDHHQVSDPAPNAVALVNPQLGVSFRELCSAGLAFKLIHAIVKRMRNDGVGVAMEFDARAYLDLVALASIADLVPLRGENRILVAAGLERLSTTQRPGLVALKAVAKCPAVLGSYEAAFQLAPRLNAAGRMQDADEALRLLLAANLADAEPLARALDGRNRERQDIERQICEGLILSLRGRFDEARDYVIVEGHSDWHLGVVGIVAARVVKEFHRPAIVLGGDGTAWRGSGRSIEGFDLAAALRECGELLARHGGHAMAAGLTVAMEKVDLLRARLNDLARQALKPEQLQRSLVLDASVELPELTMERVAELRQLEPFGQGNPEVRLAIGGLGHQQSPKRIGKEGRHAKFVVSAGATALEAVWWNGGTAQWPGDSFDLAATVSINEFRGQRSAQLKVLDWRKAEMNSFA